MKNPTTAPAIGPARLGEGAPSGGEEFVGTNRVSVTVIVVVATGPSAKEMIALGVLSANPIMALVSSMLLAQRGITVSPGTT